MKEPSMTHIERINAIVLKQLEISPDQITPEALIIEGLGADSLDVMEIGMATEEQFDITVTDDRFDEIRTMGDLYTAVAELTAAPIQ